MCLEFLDYIASSFRITFVPNWLSNYINLIRTSMLSGTWLGMAPRTDMKVLEEVGPRI